MKSDGQLHSLENLESPNRRNLAAAQIQLFLGRQIRVFATFTYQAVAEASLQRFLGKQAQAR